MLNLVRRPARCFGKIVVLSVAFPFAIMPFCSGQPAAPNASPAQAHDSAGTAPRQEPVRSPKEEKISQLLSDINNLVALKQAAEAEAKFKQLESLSPDPRILQSVRAAVAVAKGDFAAARVLYTEIAEAEPQAFNPRYNLAEILLMESKLDEARKSFLALLDRYPNHPLPLFKLLLICIREKKPGEAEAWLDRLRRLPKNPVFYYGAAALENSKGDFGRGRQWILSAEKDFGAGKQRWLYQSLEEMGLVIPGDYPGDNPASPEAAPADKAPEK
jgi:predicted Zn-dependent protease